MKKVCASGQTVRGIDVSHYQPTINWNGVKTAGLEFAFIKSTEGVSTIDRSYVSHRAGALASGLMVASYHFFHPKYDAAEQAKFMGRVVGKLGAKELPCILDFEVTDGEPASHDVENALLFMKIIKQMTGKNPILYTGPYFFQALGNGTGPFKDYPLWIAHYGTQCPLVPAPWNTWTFHQYSDKGTIPGVNSGHVDANLFNGHTEDLKKLLE